MQHDPTTVPAFQKEAGSNPEASRPLTFSGESAEREVAILRKRLDVLADRVEIQDLLSRYFLGYERGHLDRATLRSIFTEDVVVEFPPGTHVGFQGLAEFHEPLMALWDGTLHLLTNHLIQFDDHGATVQAKLVATHRHRSDDPGRDFHIGGYLDADAKRSSDGWRLRKLRLQLVWTEGDRPSGLSSS